MANVAREVDVLRQVLPENQRLFAEIFMDEDSDDEFEGFDDVIQDEDVLDDQVAAVDADLEEGNWEVGDLNVRQPVFTGEKKLKVNMTDTSKCSEFLALFLDGRFYDLLVLETNRYAEQFLASPKALTLGPHSRFRNWVPVTVAEMKEFIAIIIAMGLVQHQDLQDYWSTDVILQTPFFRSVMTRNRFLLILSFFHLNDNTTAVPKGQDGYDPVHKVRPVYDMFRSAYPAIYSPGQNLSLDEGMIAWRGNLGFRVYMPNKPNKYGVKTFEVCDSSNGYCCQLELYTGAVEEVSPKGKIYDLVMRLMNSYLNKGHHLYVDNYYTSPVLFSDLFNQDTGACGTMRKNRKGVPTAVKDKKLKKGESIAMTNGTLQVMKWADRKDVLLASTLHTGGFGLSTKRDPATGEFVRRPLCVLDYDKYMGAVDRSDQMLTYQAFLRRSVKWWKKVFFHMLMLSVLNSYILYKEHCRKIGKSPPLQRVFRKECVKEMIEAASGEKPQQADQVGEEILMRLTARHFPRKVAPKPGAKKLNPARICVVCSTTTGKRKAPGDGRRRKETTCECPKCNVGLCWQPCFGIFHQYRDYQGAWRKWNARQVQGRDGSDTETESEVSDGEHVNEQ